MRLSRAQSEPDQPDRDGEAGFDAAQVLADLERSDPERGRVRDEEVAVERHRAGPLHVHLPGREIPGTYHIGLYVEGAYCPEHQTSSGDDHADDDGHNYAHHHHPGKNECGPDCAREHFVRLLTASVAVTERADG